MEAVVLAAGRGERLRPLTNTRNKVVLPVANKPIIVRLLEQLREGGIKRVLVVVGYLSDSIRNLLGDGSELGMKIEYIEQKEILGTGHAVLQAEGYLSGRFLVLNGDIVMSSSAARSIFEKISRASEYIIFGYRHDNPAQFGILIEESGKLKEIIEKPRDYPSSALVNAGIYILDDGIFDVLRRIGRSERGEIEITQAVTELARISDVSVKRLEGNWVDVGRPWDLLRANKLVLEEMEGEIRGEVEEGARIKGKVIVGEGTIIRSGSYIEGPVLIGRNASIGPNCYIRPYTSLGDSVRVGNAVEIKNSIVMRGTRIGHLSYIGDSIIGEECNFGAGTKIANLRLDGQNVRMRLKGRRIESDTRKFGAVVGDRVRFGLNVLISPGVKIGNDSWIVPGVWISEDIPPRSIVRVKQTLIIVRRD